MIEVIALWLVFDAVSRGWLHNVVGAGVVGAARGLAGFPPPRPAKTQPAPVSLQGSQPAAGPASPQASRPLLLPVPPGWRTTPTTRLGRAVAGWRDGVTRGRARHARQRVWWKARREVLRHRLNWGTSPQPVVLPPLTPQSPSTPHPTTPLTIVDPPAPPSPAVPLARPDTPPEPPSPEPLTPPEPTPDPTPAPSPLTLLEPPHMTRAGTIDITQIPEYIAAWEALAEEATALLETGSGIGLRGQVAAIGADVPDTAKAAADALRNVFAAAIEAAETLPADVDDVRLKDLRSA